MFHPDFAAEQFEVDSRHEVDKCRSASGTYRRRGCALDREAENGALFLMQDWTKGERVVCHGAGTILSSPLPLAVLPVAVPPVRLFTR